MPAAVSAAEISGTGQLAPTCAFGCPGRRFVHNRRWQQFLTGASVDEMKRPEIGSIHRHTKTGNLYRVEGFAFNTVTDALDVLYSPLYSCDTPLFCRQLCGHPKAWTADNEDGRPRFEPVAPPPAAAGGR